MKLSRILSLIKKEFIQMTRDPRIIFMILVPPIVQLLIFGYVATTDVKHITLAIYDQDHTVMSRQLIEEFKGSNNFDLNHYVDNGYEMQDLLDGGTVVAAIRVGRGFEKKMLRGESAPLQVVLNGADSNFALIASGYISSVVQTFGGDRLKESLLKKGVSISRLGSLENKPRLLFNEELKSVNFMIPGIVAILIAVNTMLLSALAIVKEKEHGTLEQLIVTPIKPAELLMGKMVPYILTTYVQIFIAVTVGIFWFRVPFRGDILLLFGLSLIFLFTSLGLGLLISLASKTQYQAFMSGFLLIMPNIMLSGFIFPIRNMPPIIQAFTYFLPIRYFLVIIRGIFLKGVGIKYLWPEIIPLTLLGVTIFTVGVMRFRKKIS